MLETSHLFQEIYEQPDALARLLTQGQESARQIAAALWERSITHVVIAARGTSDNAARYAKYVWGAFNRLSVALATPSLFSQYQQPPQMTGALVVGVSQSGQSPDIVNVLVEGKRQGCPTLAITNNPESPLAQTADFVFDIRAGAENAVAATKTYTSQLLAIALLSAALAGDESRFSELARLPGWITHALEQNDRIAQAALRYRYMQQCVVLGRGFNYATAFEWSLKLKELTYVVAEPYSSADFQHGPIAMVASGFPVMAVAPSGAVFDDMLKLLQKLNLQHTAELLVISDRAKALDLAASPIALPQGIPEWLTPLVGIVPAQLFCYHLTRVKGFDTDAPRGLQKVTRTH
jgi:glutamine---fructose-6-phosphate transaminase (isomerizing)